jgi:hypothetical protein
MKQRLIRLFAAPVAVAFLNAIVAPAAVRAQGFEFEEEEVMDFSEPVEFEEEEVLDFSEDGWDDGAAQDDAVAAGEDTITGLIVPSEDLAGPLADQLTNVLLDELGSLDRGTVVSNESLRQEFEIMGAELAMECAFDPVCLGRYGQRLGLTRIVVGRVEATLTGGWGTTIDLFETGTSSIVNYRYFETEARTVSVQEALPAQLRQLFGIRQERASGGAGRTGPSPVQVGMAWTTAGLAVGSLAAGIAFGVKARSGESDIEDCTLVDTFDGGVTCDLTQREARPIIDDAKSNALLSNIFLGSGLFLGAISIVLFTVTPGGDIDEDVASRRQDRWRLTPSASRDGFGLHGAWTF